MLKKEKFFPFSVEEAVLWLLPEKAIFFPEESMLIVADVHWGKIYHLRRNGIPFPLREQEDLQKLAFLIAQYKPQKVIFLGDFFHHKVQAEIKVLLDWLREYEHIEFLLIEGNHDRHVKNSRPSQFKSAMSFLYKNLIFTHEPLQEIPKGMYNIHGHIHPVVLLKGRAKQFIKLPAFIFQENRGILPAFGKFTGSTIITPKPLAKVFGIVENVVVDLT
ncbi:MAG: ligase-associated DNA damage response endonuclease PdeM [Cytophagales bacterium]|nr:ligase-associated DNA damage response endonuclease PdeM [Cytophagales bacterium]MDW8383888.1 ligase-associated DNA damage response endonuclease PdeM [Flammeovirgaceae bacterium]